MENHRLRPEASSAHNLVFWFHVLVTVLAWVGPFLFSWYLLVPVYLLVLLQFMVYKRCLLNGRHQLDDARDTTFYSYIFEKLGVTVNRAVLKIWVRRYFYVILSIVTLFWQLVLKNEPLLF